MAPLIKMFSEHTDDFQTKVCVTAQHRELLDQVLDLFQIEPDFDLAVMKPGQDLFDITTSVLTGVKGVLSDFRPDCVFVHGDTTTTFASALASFYMNIRVAHVEAGLRTYNLSAPWPEEANRQLTGRIAGYHFAPTQKAREHLLSEGTPPESVVVTGNTVIDALNLIVEKNADQEIQNKLRESVKKSGYPMGSRRIVLLTTHRRENFGQGFENICCAVRILAGKYTDIDFILPVHLNPNVRKVVFETLSGVENIYLIEPLEYQTFVYLMSQADIILTDSGGIQEEAPSLGKPVLVMREKTERPEAVEAGTVRLVGTDSDKIVGETIELLENRSTYMKMATAHNPYGDGKACDRIIEFIKDQA